MGHITYKKFRHSEKEFYLTKEGRMSRSELIKKLESFLKQKLGEGDDFFQEYDVREEK